MKRYLLIAAIILLQVSGTGAQDLSAILSKLDSSRVSLDFSCTVDNAGTPLRLKGNALAQGNCYRVDAAGMEVRCNGSCRWTVDREAREVYIEEAEGLEEFVSEPERYLGAVSDLRIDRVEYTAASEDLSAFCFDTEALGADWVVTDLR